MSTPAEIAAYIGATAWGPHLIHLVRSLMLRPRLHVSVAETVEIGYTSFGPIVNLTCAISSKQKDALIESIEIKITHEKGDTRTMQWVTTNETFSEIRNSSTGEHAQVTKRSNAVALQVSTSALAEKQINFQDRSFSAATRNLLRAASGAYFQMRRESSQASANSTTSANDMPEGIQDLTGGDNTDVKSIVPNFVQREPWRDYQQHYTNGMCWQPGRYSIELYLHEASLRSPHRQTFQMELSASDVALLRANVEEFVVDFLKFNAQEAVRPPRWNWVYPAIGKT